MRAGAGLATVAVASLLVAGCGGGARGTHVQDPHAAVLRAGDMARGYAEGDDTACGIADTEEEDSPLARLFVEERPRACIIELARVWEGGTGPRGVTSAAYVFRNAAAAERGFRARSPLLEYSASLRMRTETGVDLGDEARLVRGPGLNDPAVAVVWRSGNVVAILAVEPASVRAALALARRQQRRILGPAPAPHRVDTIELQLDDPALALPVYWLGRSFHPGHGLTELDLNDARAARTGASLEYVGVTGGRVTVWGKETRFALATVDSLRRRGGGRRSWSFPRDPMRGWWRGARPTVALDVAPALSAVVAAAARCSVRREHAIDAMAVGATVCASGEGCTAAQSSSALSAGEKAADAGRQRPENTRRQLPPAGPADGGPVGSARQRRGQGRLPAPSADRRRPGRAPGRAGTQTNWGRCAAAPAPGPRCATRSRSSSPRR